MKEHCCAEIVPIFNHLDYESLMKISSITIHTSYKKGETLFSPNQLGKLFIVAKGKVKIYQLSTSGKEQLLRVLEPGDFIGEEVLFGIENNETWGEALIDTQICAIHQKDFMELLEKYPTISLALLKEYTRRLHDLEHLATGISTQSVETRLIHYLGDLEKVQGGKLVILPLPMKELAAFLGTTPETISRKFKELEDMKIIERQGKRITILKALS